MGLGGGGEKDLVVKEVHSLESVWRRRRSIGLRIGIEHSLVWVREVWRVDPDRITTKEELEDSSAWVNCKIQQLLGKWGPTRRTMVILDSRALSSVAVLVTRTQNHQK
jgi:hypothetical protein